MKLRPLIFSILLLLPVLTGAANEPPSTRPNMLVILCDDLGFGDTSLTGHPVIQTPRIEALRTQSAFCTHYYAPANICSPSRAAMLTGRMPYRLGIYSFIRDAQDYVHLDRSEVTLPQVLQKVGYQCANIGKWHVSHLDATGPRGIPTMREYGFDYWLSSDNNLKILNKPDWWRNEKRLGTINGYAGTVVSDAALRWLSEERDPKKPFLLFANYYEPHADSDAPESLKNKYTALGQGPGLARYFACVEHLDIQIGRVLDQLDTLNLSKDTLVLFTSDHGPNPSSTSRFGTATPYRGTKYQVWDGSTHVPALFRWPGVIAPGSTLSQPMGTIDLLQTFASIAGASQHLPTDRPLDGTNCSPLLRGAKSITRSTPLQWHYYKSSAKLLTPGSPQAAMRIGDQVIAGWYASPVKFNNVRWMPDPKQNGGIEEMDYVRGTGKHSDLRLSKFRLYDVVNDPHQDTDLFDPTNAQHLALRDRLVASHETLRSQAPDWNQDATRVPAILPPRIVGIPPADAGRGLVRVSPTEIRHYAGKGGTSFLQSLDNGETWHSQPLPKTYPDATCLSKESPSVVPIPGTREYFRVEPLYRKKPHEGIYRSQGGIDGTWNRLEDAEGNPILPSGILRTPIWVNQNKRILIPGHGGGCFTWNSDDNGANWTRSNTLQSPPHEAKGIHAGTRWNHGMVEATIMERTDGTLWMIARTAQDQHWQSFSKDYGTTWSPSEPSRFWGTITMPTFFRMQDGRMLFVWSNTTPLPEVYRKKRRAGEDVFTNRDALHAAISKDDGKTWIGFREILLDEHRNNANYGVTAGSNDRGKHQSEVIQLDQHRVLLSAGQHPLHRKLVIMDVRWLYEKERTSSLATDARDTWTTHQYINKIVGHCGYNRTPGAAIEGGALRLRRVEDPSLTNPNQGATWNFPTGHTGTFTCTIRQESGGARLQVALTDRWFNATDTTVEQLATFVLKTEGTKLLTPGKTHELVITWTKEAATVAIDGKSTGITLPRLHPTPNGISYVHFYNPATQTDPHGFSIFNTKVTCP